MADTDGNPDTVADPTWMPLIATPPYPEYDSGHQSVSRSSATILIAYFGDDLPFAGFSENSPGVTRSYANFTAAADEAFMMRTFSVVNVPIDRNEPRRSLPASNSNVPRFISLVLGIRTANALKVAARPSLKP